ncbi:gamma carbonic anhydrase family protein [Polymorphobacter glacialis]|uniref:Gamma carbonic anhydrase family protein n=1 Tax=Sandarakinorhabdus glacialis TaxID=1614636 RepID=A0A916ZZY9_9SPHN|nr:gamma carbonic anhydrase family protein [Polymorphobacter glacialis]GGE20528.1 gamma carbonic anhydrase family protein [Polymorphobacter glacialis]
MSIHPFGDKHPLIAPTAFIAPGARVIGDVTIGDEASIWYNVVLRGDVERITIGVRTNIQDGSVVHVTTNRYATLIGDDVLIGHLAMIHGCVLENHAFIGLGAIVMDDCVVETDAMLAAGALLTPGKRIGSRELWAGRPAKLLRMLSDEDVARNRSAAAGYVALAKLHRASLA